MVLVVISMFVTTLLLMIFTCSVCTWARLEKFTTYMCGNGVECCSYENPDYGYYLSRREDCAMLASSGDSHSPAAESNVVGTPASSLHSSLITSGDDQSTLLGRRSYQGFRSQSFGFI